jgi:hypothetical protein
MERTPMPKARRKDTQSTAQPPPPGWMPILEAFSLVSHITGSPDVAASDIWRELVAGRVHALRRRTLADGVKYDQLDRAFWRGVKLYAGTDARGRDTLCLRLAKNMDAVAISECTFFLRHDEVERTWLFVTKAPTSRLSKRALNRKNIREALTRIYPPDGEPPENIKHKSLEEAVNTDLKNHGKSPASLDTILRVAGLRSG